MTAMKRPGRANSAAGHSATGKKENSTMRGRSTAGLVILVATAAWVATFAMVGVRAQAPARPLAQATSLKSLVVQDPPNLGDFVQDKAAAIRLGKAFFWEQQASSDNLLACASCHFHAGADFRTKNVINPNLTNTAGQPTSTTFNQTATANKGGANYAVRAGDFPFHQLQDPNDRESTVLYDSNDVVGSAGVFNSEFGQVLSVTEKQTYAPDGVFQVGTAQTRRVEPRNTPSVINAALNFRNFWDGRANFVFNGVNPFGPRDETARIWVSDLDANGVVTAKPNMVRIPFASAASQAVGPALSAFEMSGSGRQFADIGHKLLGLRPLGTQAVSPSDSVLGPYRFSLGAGLNTTYETMIKAAFWPEYYQVPDATFKAVSGTTYRQIEMNFSLFWGLAIQLYESTLISNDSRYDRYAAGDWTQLTDQEQLGLAIFSSDRGKCVNCHKGAEFTGASTRMVLGTGVDSFGGDGPIENMLMGDRSTAIYDNGFYNIGLVPAGNDLGVGGNDPFGYPLSFTREYKNMMKGAKAPDTYSHSLNPCDFQSVEGCALVIDANMRDATDGAFKVPSLRNVELTGPYFHTGGFGTLEQVVDFYNRGGNVRQTNGGDTSGYGPNASNHDSDVMPLGLNATEKAALVAFLKSLTDDRVRYERAPFDHPALRVPHGAQGDNVTVTVGSTGKAVDQFMTIPAVGATGLTTPITPFTPQP